MKMCVRMYVCVYVCACVSVYYVCESVYVFICNVSL